MSNLVVQTNVLALNSHRNLTVIGTKQATASARLSSGYRINSAADDAAGLAISEKMRGQIRGLDMASKNTQDGISLVQTAEGGLQEVDNMIQRIRELAVQAANDTNDFNTADRKKLQDEIDQLTQGIDQMGTQVEFNAKKLLDGSAMDASTKGSLLADLNVKIQNAIGATTNAGVEVSVLTQSVAANKGQLGIEFNDATSSAIVASSAYTVTLTQDGITATAQMSAAASGGTIAVVAGSNLSSAQAVKDYVGAIDYYVGQLQDAKKNGAAGVDDVLANLAKNRQAALDIYAGLELVSAQTKSYEALSKVTGSGLYFQTGANSMQGVDVGIGKISSDVLGIGKGNGISTIKVDKPNAFEVSAQVDIINNALQYVTSERAKLGAVQNRLEYTKSSLDISSENLSAAESRIRDTDMAKEMMNLTSANVLQQAGVSMLAQANQAPQSILSLLR